MRRPGLGEVVKFAAPGGGDEGEVVHAGDGRALALRRRRGDPVLFVVAAMNGWRLVARYQARELLSAIAHATRLAAGRRVRS
jgi:hypothetical protein